MPGCIHHHRHAAWPNRGPLVICPGERTCGFCEGEAAAVEFASAGALRRHVVGEHTDGGRRDFGGVEVMMCREVRRSRGRGRRTRAQAPVSRRQGVQQQQQQQYREPQAAHEAAYSAYHQPSHITPQAPLAALQQQPSLPPPPADSAAQAFYRLRDQQAYYAAPPPQYAIHQPEATDGLYTFAPSYTSDYAYYPLQQQSFSAGATGQWSGFDPIVMPAAAPQGYGDVPRVFEEAQMMQGYVPSADYFVPQQQRQELQFQEQMSLTSYLGAVGREWVWRRAGSGVLET